MLGGQRAPQRRAPARVVLAGADRLRQNVLGGQRAPQRRAPARVVLVRADRTFFVTCHPGISEVVAQEILTTPQIAARDIKVGPSPYTDERLLPV